MVYSAVFWALFLFFSVLSIAILIPKNVVQNKIGLSRKNSLQGDRPIPEDLRGIVTPVFLFNVNNRRVDGRVARFILQ